jgi:hypothetical protein
VVAQQVAGDQLIPRLMRKQSIALNFANIDICTQSFLHALLFDALRIAWATQTPVYVRNAAPAVRDGLKLLESYSLVDDDDVLEGR